jgi:DNA-binding response OmpR family regulator
MRILLAEDEKELSNALVAILKHNNYSVDAVYDGEDAVDYALTENYDVIVLDIMMPKMDGLEALKELRSHGISTPVLMLTAKSEVKDRISGLDTGADDYLTKPFFHRRTAGAPSRRNPQEERIHAQHPHLRQYQAE